MISALLGVATGLSEHFHLPLAKSAERWLIGSGQWERALRQSGLFGLSDHMKQRSADGDPLEVAARLVDFEAFRPTLVAAWAYADGSKGGRPPYDPVVMLKVLGLAAQNNVSDARMEWLIPDRLSWLRFLGVDLGVATPDANTIRTFRERLTNAGALDPLFADFDRQLKARGYACPIEAPVRPEPIAAPG